MKSALHIKTKSDNLSVKQRKKCMSAIKSINTKPELIARSVIFKLGYRYFLHSKYLPGHPDMVFSRRRKVIFINGCFWHRHSKCVKGRSIPKSNKEFWLKKLSMNALRDKEVYSLLKKIGWTYLVLWECELRNISRISKKIRNFLDQA